jgi:hypothetical protein
MSKTNSASSKRGSGSTAESKYIDAERQPSTTQSMTSTEHGLVVEMDERTVSACSSCDEPSPKVLSVKMSFRVMKAKFFHDINGEVDQFNPGSAANFKDADKKRISTWMERVATATKFAEEQELAAKEAAGVTIDVTQPGVPRGSKPPSPTDTGSPPPEYGRHTSALSLVEPPRFLTECRTPSTMTLRSARSDDGSESTPHHRGMLLSPHGFGPNGFGQEQEVSSGNTSARCLNMLDDSRGEELLVNETSDSLDAGPLPGAVPASE